MPLDKKILNVIKKEIETDPDGRGYSGKTPEQVAKLMSSSVEVKTDILYTEPVKPKVGDKIGEKIEVKPPRIGSILGGVEGVPNVFTAEDIEEAIK